MANTQICDHFGKTDPCLKVFTLLSRPMSKKISWKNDPWSHSSSYGPYTRVSLPPIDFKSHFGCQFLLSCTKFMRQNKYQIDLIKQTNYPPSQYQFGSDVTSASFAFNWSHRCATLTRAARRYACCVYTEQALILSDVTTKLLVTWIVITAIYQRSGDKKHRKSWPRWCHQVTLLLPLPSIQQVVTESRNKTKRVELLRANRTSTVCYRQPREMNTINAKWFPSLKRFLKGAWPDPKRCYEQKSGQFPQKLGYHTKVLYSFLWDTMKHIFGVCMKTTGAISLKIGTMLFGPWGSVQCKVENNMWKEIWTWTVKNDF